MKIVVVGLGGVGGVVGGRLAAGLGSEEHEVVFWCRGETLRVVASEGLRVLGADGTRTACSARATHDIADVKGAGLLVFATKGYHLEDAAREIAPALNAQTVAIPLLNGVSAPAILEKYHCDALGGCVYISAHVEKPGTVRQVGSVQRVFFGKQGVGLEENTTRYGHIQRLLAKSGLDVTLTERIDVEMWSKFVFLSPFAGVTALFELSISQVLAKPESFETVKQMINEIEALARAKNIALPQNIAEVTLEKARAFAPLTKTSMQIDREKGRPMELEHLIGYVRDEGRTLNIPTPAYDAVYKGLMGK
ncbi:MAG: 2-dehydropantoate 2-reductase [Synergistaceae bacterium]|nr:2-dehydropantoate 2-reductase [Synergistaceae bacterium]